LPTGTVAFMFTDIEGSTVRWDRDRVSMQQAVRHHDDLMRAAIARHGGHVFKTIGDAFCAVFALVEEAVAAALDAQRTLAAADFSAVEGIRVRMALHVGAADERDGDYFGPTLNRVARLLAIGHGGQVLVSGAAAALVAASLPEDATLVDMGEHRLKDLAQSEHVYQLSAAGLATDFPKLRSLGVFDTNLPQQLSSFIGRDNDVAVIEKLLDGARLVTLFGTGGLGKTRCSQQVGAKVLEQFTDGVWFVDLAPLADPALVPNEIGTIFGVQEAANRPMLETLTAHLARKNVLLLLDNCEHVIVEAARTASAILASCSKVKILATSREALKIAGEVVYRMPSLAVPAPSSELAADSALSYGAVALFDDRARAANHAFRISDESAPAVAEICRRLDGIPLAIELAAARMKILSPSQLARQLDERFRVLTGGDRTALPRQQTMRALIDWSYDLLSADEQHLFRDLSVFAGSFSLQTAMDVCATPELSEFEVLDLLSSLVDKSFVLSEPAEPLARYRLLESIRQYGREKSFELGEAPGLARRHAETYARLSERLDHDYESVALGPWVQEAESELENVRAALTWSFGGSGDPLVGQRIAATLRRVWAAFAAAEARRWAATAIASVTEATPPHIVAQLELAEATLASMMNQFRAARKAAERALALFEQQNDARGIANAQRWAGRSLVYLGELDEGETLLEKALAALRALGFKREGGILRDLASVRSLRDDVVGARQLFAEALKSFRDADDEYNVAVTAGTLAEAEFRCGDAEAAVSAAQEALKAARARRLESRLIAWSLSNLAAFYLALGDYGEAREYARAALRLRHDAQIDIDVAFSVQHLAGVAALRTPGDYRLAATLLAFVDARLEKLEVAREYTEQLLYDKITGAVREAPQAELDEASTTGRGLTEERAVTLALTV
jgi:predicted ATPase/class 3 adenylate cyclase